VREVLASRLSDDETAIFEDTGYDRSVDGRCMRRGVLARAKQSRKGETARS
jgi:hypothetical protein